MEENKAEASVNEVKPITEGDHILYVDPYSKPRQALVTAVWKGEYGTHNAPGCNFVFVSDDESRHDAYGRQVERVLGLPQVGATGAWELLVLAR